MYTTKRKALAALDASVASLTVAIVAIRTRQSRKRSPRPKGSRRSANFRRAALLHPIRSSSSTPWNQILSYGIDDDFLLSTNFTRSLVLDKLLPWFQAEREICNFGSPFRHGPKTRGRHPILRSADLLGLGLWYLEGKCSIYKTCPTFGVTDSLVVVWLDYSLEVLARVVKKNKEFEVRWPSVAEMEQYDSLLRSNRVHGSLLDRVFAITDGCRMPCADYTESNLQNAFYESFTTAVEVTNLFVFNFFGEIIHAAVNFPGSWHDNKLATASGLYFLKLSDDMTPPGYAIIGDTAFVNNPRATNGKVVCGRKGNETRNIPESAHLAAVNLLLQRAMPSERQSAEWVIRAIKSPFAKLKVPLPADASERLRLLTLCCHLLNYRTRFVGLNQIRTVYGTVQERS